MIYKHDHDFKFSNYRFGLNGILIGVYKNVLSSSKINDRYFAFSLKRCIFASNFRSSHFEPVLRCFSNINFCVFREPLSHEDTSKNLCLCINYVCQFRGRVYLSAMIKKKRARSRVRKCQSTSRRVWNWNGINLSFPLSSMCWEACSFCTCSFEPKQLREPTASLRPAPKKLESYKILSVMDRG